MMLRDLKLNVILHFLTLYGGLHICQSIEVHYLGENIKKGTKMVKTKVTIKIVFQTIS